MAEKLDAQIPEKSLENDAELSSSDDEECGNLWMKKIRISNATDFDLRAEVEVERETSNGGTTLNATIEGNGFGYTGATKNHKLISRTPERTIPPHKITKIRYEVDSMFGKQARLIVKIPKELREIFNSKEESPEELVIKNKDCIIVKKDGSLAYATKSKFKPVDYTGNDLDKKTYERETGRDFDDEIHRQRKWIPNDETGSVWDRIRDPHLKNGIELNEDC